MKGVIKRLSTLENDRSCGIHSRHQRPDKQVANKQKSHNHKRRYKEKEKENR